MAQDLPHPGRADLNSGLIPAALLAAVPGCESGRPPLAVHALVGGGHNDVRLVESAAGRFVVRSRLPPVVRAGSSAALELECQQLAAQNGLAPRVVAAANDASWMVMDFIDGSPWQQRDLLSTAGVRRLGGRLALVHAMPVPAGRGPMDAQGIATAQLQVINSNATSTAVLRDEAFALANRSHQLATILQGSDMRRCINHGDLQVANLIGDLPLFIDWEYAQITSPTYDIACLMTYYPGLQAWKPELLAASGLTRPEDLECLGLQEQLFASLNRLWAIAHGVVGGPGAG